MKGEDHLDGRWTRLLAGWLGAVTESMKAEDGCSAHERLEGIEAALRREPPSSSIWPLLLKPLYDLLDEVRPGTTLRLPDVESWVAG